MERKVLYFGLLLLLCFFSINTTCASINYEFVFEAEHDFEEDEEIECEVRYDDEEKIWSMDENSDDDDLEFSKKFNTKVEISCDRRVDELTFYVYDSEDDRIYKEVIEEEKNYEYVINVVDENFEWFSIYIEHDFGAGKQVECTLEVDNREFEFEFSDDSDDDDFEILKNYEEDVTFNCDDELDEIEFVVYDDEGDEVFEKVYNERKFFDFDIEDLEGEYEFKLDIDHDFDEGEEIECSLSIDDNNDLDEEFVFNKDVDDEEFSIFRNFREKFEFDCDDDLDLIELKVYDENGDKVDDLDFEDDDEIEYEYNQGYYDFIIEILTEFEGDTDCDLIVDDVAEEEFEFSSSSRKSDMRIEDTFDLKIEFSCDEEFGEALVYVFEHDEDHEGDLMEQRSYLNMKSFVYVLGESDEEEVEEETEVEEEDSLVVDASEDVEPEDSNLSSDVEDSIINGYDSLNGMDDNETVAELSNQSLTGEGVDKESSNSGVWIFGSFLAGLIIIAIILGIVKLRGKRKPKVNVRKDKVDLEYLKEREFKEEK